MGISWVGVILCAAPAWSATVAIPAPALTPVPHSRAMATAVPVWAALPLYDDASRLEVDLDLDRPVVSTAPNGFAPRAHATEPATLVLLGTGLLGLATILRRRSL